MLTCRELVEFMDDYWSGALAPETVARFNEHLAACPSCVSYTNTWHEAIRVGRAAVCAADGEVPSDVPEALVAAILASRAASS